MTDEQAQTLITFMDRWEAANREVNGDSYYQNYQISNNSLVNLVQNFTLDQKKFIQSQLDEARCNIGYANVLK